MIHQLCSMFRQCEISPSVIIMIKLLLNVYPDHTLTAVQTSDVATDLL